MFACAYLYSYTNLCTYETIGSTAKNVPGAPVVAYAEAVEANPWGEETAVVCTKNPYDDEWALQSYVAQYKPQFDKVQVNGFVSGAAAKGALQGTGAPVSVLRKVWDLADVDKDGQLSLNEFVIALYLAEQAKQGVEVPSALDACMIPPR